MKELIETLNNCKAILTEHYEFDLHEVTNEYDVDNQKNNIDKIILMIENKEFK